MTRPRFIEQYIMTDPSLCTSQTEQTVGSDSKKQVFKTYHTNIPLRLLLYINIIFAYFWLLKIDMIAARIIFLQNEGRFFYEPGDSIYFTLNT